MPNNPVQVVLNTDNFIGRPEQNPGGSIKDFFAGRDAEFAAHKGRLLQELGEIRQQIQKNPELGVEYAHVVLQSEAWAKSRRPMERVLPLEQIPLIGGGSLGELLVELTVENIPVVSKAIERAEETVIFKRNEDEVEVPKPTRDRSEVGSIQTIRSHQPADRRTFSAEDAVQWMEDPRTGGIYIVETFVDLLDLKKEAPRRARAKAALQRFLDTLSTINLPVIALEPPPRLRGHRLLFVRLDDDRGASRPERIALHQRFLEFLDQQPAVRRVLLPPLIDTGHTAHGVSGAPVDVAAPIESARYPVVGIIDTGIAPVSALERWCAGRTDFVGAAGQDRSHGTFIAGLAVAGAQLN